LNVGDGENTETEIMESAGKGVRMSPQFLQLLLQVNNLAGQMKAGFDASNLRMDNLMLDLKGTTEAARRDGLALQSWQARHDSVVGDPHTQIERICKLEAWESEHRLLHASLAGEEKGREEVLEAIKDSRRWLITSSSAIILGIAGILADLLIRAFT
jgi:hypothetical protein